MMKQNILCHVRVKWRRISLANPMNMRSIKHRRIFRIDHSPTFWKKWLRFYKRKNIPQIQSTTRFNLKEYRSKIFEVDSTGVCLIFEGEIENSLISLRINKMMKHWNTRIIALTFPQIKLQCFSQSESKRLFLSTGRIGEVFPRKASSSRLDKDVFCFISQKTIMSDESQNGFQKKNLDIKLKYEEHVTTV